MWQPYEAHFDDLLLWCVAGRAVWTTTVSLVCFHPVEIHTLDRVVRQFGMIQEISCNVDTNRVLHGIDLRGKIGVNWMQKHVVHIHEWGNCLYQRCEAVLGDMPPQHEYHDWFKRVTWRFIDRPGAVVTLLVTSQCLLHLTVFLSMKPLFREHDACYYIFCLALDLPIICNYY